MEQIIHRLKEQQNKKIDFYTPYGLHVYFKDEMLDDTIDVESAVSKYESVIPQHLLPNIEMIVSRLIDVNKLGGFHFNDSKFGDDDLDAGSINPYELFLIFNELTAASQNNKIKNIAFMIDQSHNVTDPIESLISSANEIVNSYTKSLLVNFSSLEKAQDSNDAIQSMQILKTAFNTDVSPIVAMARYENGNSIDPIKTYRKLDYKKNKSLTRKNEGGSSSGIV